MIDEPMFNIEERAPLWLASLLIGIFAAMSFGPKSLTVLLNSIGILIPLQTEQVPPLRQAVSAIASGFLHMSWTHVLVNSGMIIAFAVITMRGIRALESEREIADRANIKFFAIFILGTLGASLFQWGWWAAIETVSAAAMGASGGASALFATAAWAMGGKDRLLKFGAGWALINLIFVLAEPIFGGIAWAGHAGGYIVGALLAPYLVRPFSSGFSITR